MSELLSDAMAWFDSLSWLGVATTSIVLTVVVAVALGTVDAAVRRVVYRSGR